MKKITILLVLLCFLTSCPFLENHVGFTVKNNSSSNIRGYIDTGTAYPDTILPEKSRFGFSVAPNLQFYPNFIGDSLEDVFRDRFPNDTVSLAIVSADTIAKYGWEDVRANHRVLVRYDLSYPDFMLLNKVITYPPTPEMSHMKMWPPYQQVINKAKQRQLY